MADQQHQTRVFADSDYDVLRIMEKIPHRSPFLLIDRVAEVTPFDSVKAIKGVTYNEPFFMGHFPKRPVMPGVLIVEAMAQAAGVLVVESLGADAEGKLVYFMSIEEAKFRKTVTPGHTLDIRAKVTQSRKSVWKFRGEAYIEGALCAEACFTAMIVDP